jgi:hypothetical protein
MNSYVRQSGSPLKPALINILAETNEWESDLNRTGQMETLAIGDRPEFGRWTPPGI